jgi:triphosphoribosyl-dephospho-CoA synthase
VSGPVHTRSFCFQAACVWEATARKAGNVHRYADFDDCTYLDFLMSAAAAAPFFDAAPHRGVGETVLDAVRATRSVVRTNTNLGICLLIAPLAAVPDDVPLREGVPHVLAATSVEDSRQVYEAIRLANPGGLGTAGEQDVADEPTLPLVEVMKLAADRDLVAESYADEFHHVFLIADRLNFDIQKGECLESAVRGTHLLVMGEGDSLIRRKCGDATAEAVGLQAAEVWHLRSHHSRGEYEAAFAAFDAWLRADGHRRNPGTSADLIAAALFVLLREGSLDPLTVRF